MQENILHKGTINYGTIYQLDFILHKLGKQKNWKQNIITWIFPNVNEA